MFLFNKIPVKDCRISMGEAFCQRQSHFVLSCAWQIHHTYKIYKSIYRRFLVWATAINIFANRQGKHMSDRGPPSNISAIKCPFLINFYKVVRNVTLFINLSFIQNDRQEISYRAIRDHSQNDWAQF
jgi:hypothetical protein